MEWLIPNGYPGSPALYVFVTLVAFVMTGVSKGGFGGVGILAIPLMMMVAPADLALGMWLPLLILCDVFTLRAYPKEWLLRPIALLAPWVPGRCNWPRPLEQRSPACAAPGIWRWWHLWALTMS